MARINKLFLRSLRFLSLSVFLFAITLSGSGIALAINGQYNEAEFSGADIRLYNPATTCGANDGVTVTRLNGGDNREKIWNFLVAKGLSNEQTAGVMGNLQTESGGSWNPMVNEYGKEFGSAGFGIAQWTGGRRTAIVSYLNTKAPSEMTNYYNANYAVAASATTQESGFIPKHATDDTPMPVEANDLLLLEELNFLYDESKSRTISQTSIDKGLGSAGENEWDALKKLTTIEDASRLWVYSFERPADVETTAIARAVHGQTIFDLYADGTSTTGECASASKQALAQQIIDSGNVVYFESDIGAKKIFEDVASGANNGNDYPCGININILQMVAAMVKDHRIQITSLNRACISDLSPTSRHYAGNGSGIDFDWIDNMPAELMPGATLLVEISTPFLVPGSRVGQSYDNRYDPMPACLPNLAVPDGVTRIVDACHHLHIDVPPNSDPNLKCKGDVSTGDCDESQRV